MTQRGNRRQRTFFEERDFRRYIALMGDLKDKLRVEIWAYCLMPNHVHFVAVPDAADGLARLFGRVHHLYARRINRPRDWQGHLWQQRFYSSPMDEQHLLAAVRYVELNPVRGELCERPEDWPWSSARAHLGRAADPLVDTEPMLKRIGDWRTYLDDDSRPDLTESLRRSTRTGRPAGNDYFIDSVEALTGRRLRLQRTARESWSVSVELPAVNVVGVSYPAVLSAEIS